MSTKPETRAESHTPGAMRAAMEIGRARGCSDPQGPRDLDLLAEIIDRETGVLEMLEVLQELSAAIEAKADIGNRRQLTVSPRMEEALIKGLATIRKAGGQ